MPHRAYSSGSSINEIECERCQTSSGKKMQYHVKVCVMPYFYGIAKQKNLRNNYKTPPASLVTVTRSAGGVNLPLFYYVLNLKFLKFKS